MTKELFEIMVDDFMSDQTTEFENDPLIIEGIEQDNFGFVCYAKDSKNNYELRNDGEGNIVLSYIGTV